MTVQVHCYSMGKLRCHSVSSCSYVCTSNVSFVQNARGFRIWHAVPLWLRVVGSGVFPRLFSEGKKEEELRKKRAEEEEELRKGEGKVRTVGCILHFKGCGKDSSWEKIKVVYCI